MRPEHPSDPDYQTLDLGSGPVHYTDVGTGPVVVALHGCPGSVRDWRWLGAALEPHLRVIRIDLPGFGQTPLSVEPNPSFEERARWVLQVLDVLGVDRFCALGHSAGGPLALTLAAEHPQRAACMALLGAPGVRPHRPLRRTPWAPYMHHLLDVSWVAGPMTRWLRWGFELQGFPKNLPDDAIAQTMRIVAQFDFAMQARRIDGLSVPSLVAWTDDDVFIDADISRELAQRCSDGPRLGFADGGHYLQKTRSVEVADALVPWAASVLGTGGSG
jgi:pimeloyl-ACP methyl ester carboxylesterase